MLAGEKCGPFCIVPGPSAGGPLLAELETPEGGTRGLVEAAKGPGGPARGPCAEGKALGGGRMAVPPTEGGTAPARGGLDAKGGVG